LDAILQRWDICSQTSLPLVAGCSGSRPPLIFYFLSSQN